MRPNIVPFLSEAARQSYERGRADERVATKAAAAMAVLHARGLVLSEAQRARIASCTDIATLDRWILRAATVASADQLFDDRDSHRSEAAREVFHLRPNFLPFLSEAARQSYERGRTDGMVETKAADVVTLLGARGLALSGAQRARIASCTDITTLDRWIRRAATIASADQLFDD